MNLIDYLYRLLDWCILIHAHILINVLVAHENRDLSHLKKIRSIVPSVLPCDNFEKKKLKLKWDNF